MAHCRTLRTRPPKPVTERRNRVWSLKSPSRAGHAARLSGQPTYEDFSQLSMYSQVSLNDSHVIRTQSGKKQGRTSAPHRRDWT